MNQFIFRMISCFVFALLLSACKSMTPDTAKRAYCNMLKSDIVFNGSTGVTRQANIQASEAPLQEQTYDAEGCDDSNRL